MSTLSPTRILVFVLTHLACSCHGRRVQSVNQPRHDRSSDHALSERQRSSKAFASFLLSSNPAAAFRPSNMPVLFAERRALSGLHDVARNRRIVMKDGLNEHKLLTQALAASAVATSLFTPWPVSAEEAASQGLALPSFEWPSFAWPDWVVAVWNSPELKQLGIYFAQTLISWSVPIGAVGIALAFYASISSRNKRGDKDVDIDLPDQLSKAFGISQEPKEFLEIQRLNDKFQSFDYSLTKALVSKEAALRQNRKLTLQQRVSREIAAFDLDAEVVRRIEENEKKYRKEDARLVREIEKKMRMLRAEPFESTARTGRNNTQAEADSDESAKTFATEVDDESKFEFSLEGLKSVMPSSPRDKKKMKMKRMQDEILDLQEERSTLEVEFLKSISRRLSPEQAAAFAAAIKPSSAVSSGDPGAGAIDAISSLEHIATATRARSKHVWVLNFFGDVTASQVSSLRQEVTAVLRAAEADRGDEVLIVLNTGGGTVTGYGLAGAQLSRIKAAGLDLTICVEQVAASGGYLMACVADKIFASPFAVIGSIGVITEIPNVYERLLKEGVEFSTVTAGKYKRTLTPTKKIDPLDKEKTKEDIEQVFNIFKGWVGRHRPQLDIDKVATGETWLGVDALDMKLVDGLVTVDEVLSNHATQGAEVYSLAFREPKKPGLAGIIGANGEFESSLTWQSLALALFARAIAPQSNGLIDEPWLRSALSRVAPSLTDERSAAPMTEDFERQYLAKRPMGEAEPMFSWRGREDSSQSWTGL